MESSNSDEGFNFPGLPNLVRQLLLQNPSPERRGFGGQTDKFLLDLCGEAGAIPGREELLDVPSVLRPAGVELQEDQVGSLHNGDFPLAPPGIFQSPPLPGKLANDQVDWPLTLQLEAHQPSEGIPEVPSPNFYLDALTLQIGPKLWIEAERVDSQ